MLTSRKPIFVVILVTLASLVPALASATGSTAALSTWKLKKIALPVADVAYDPSRDKLLALVMPDHGSLGNKLVEVNPRTGALGRTVFVGSSPHVLAPTADGSSLYVGLSGTNRIVRVDLATFQVAASFTVGGNERGLFLVEDLEAQPGRNDTVVASLRAPGYTPSFAGLVAYRNGEPLPLRGGPADSANRFEFVDSSTLLAYDNRSTGHAIRKFALDDNGLALSVKSDTAITGFNVDIEYAGGLLFSSNGVAIDASTLSSVHSFDVPGAHLVEVTPDTARATYLAGDTISVHSTITGQPLDSRELSEFPSWDSTRALVASGEGFALAATDGLYLLGPAVGGGPVFIPAVPAGSLWGMEFSYLELAPNDLEFDSARNRLYASVGSGSPERPNELVAIDPSTTEVLEHIPIPGNPDSLAMTGDGSHLFVYVKDTGEIKRVALDTFSVTSSFSVGIPSSVVANEIEVKPGTTDTIAVSLSRPCCDPEPEEVAIYKSGVRLADSARAATGPDHLEFADASTLYGLNSRSTPFKLYRMEVDAQGVRRSAGFDWLIPGSNRDFELVDGKAYSNSKIVVDPVAGEWIGQFGGGPFGAASAVEIVPGSSRAFFAGFMGIGGFIDEFDLKEFRLIASYQVNVHFTKGVGQMVNTEVGFAIGGDRLVIAGPPRQYPPPPTPPPTPPPPPPPPTDTPDALSWGWNGLGHLGTGNTADRAVPSEVAGLEDVVQVSTGLHHSLALKADGTVWAWGFNGTGSLGDGTTSDRLAPVRVSGLTDVVSISSGFLHNLAVRSDGTVWAWGWNYFGQLGNGNEVQQTRPVRVNNLDNVSEVSAGAFHSLARRSDGSVWAWGWNVLHQLGDGTDLTRLEPVRAHNLSRIASISAGGLHSAASDEEGQVWTWGWNGLGQLGDGTTVDQPEPRLLPATGNVVKVSAGFAHNLLLSKYDLVFSWGWNALGQLGDGTLTDRHSPVRVAGSYDEISAGLLHNLAVRNGELWAWGWNALGQLGDGTTTDRPAPTRIALLGVDEVAAGSLHSLAAEGVS